ncbi:MAG: efflux RND transporter periplasmic adaptor subunit [Sphingobacteriaceae bacterium]|nr:efflux RND transporter periplasmic adaptor subunit [Sphingobacteriaceae bacterium]
MFQKYLLAGGLVLLTLASCNRPEKNAAVEAISLPLLKLVPTDTAVDIDYVADIHAQNYVEVRARFGGMIEAILVDEGQRVRKGQPLFKLSATEAEAAVASARASVQLAEAELRKTKLEAQRVLGLVKSKVVAATEQQLAEAEVEIAKAKLQDAKSNLLSRENQLSFSVVTAPFAGRINRIVLKMGAMVEPGQLMTTLSDISNILAYFSLSEKDYLENRRLLRAGEEGLPSTAQLILSDGTLYEKIGTIETAETEFDEETGTIALRARFPNQNELLKHRSSGVVRLQLIQRNIFMVPQKAVQELQDKYFVYVVGSNQLAMLRAFKPKGRVGSYYLVGEELQAGEQIIAEGVLSVREGSKVVAATAVQGTQAAKQ